MPVLLVHGIWNTGLQFSAMRRALEAASVAPAEVIDLEPNTGTATIPELAAQVAARAEAICKETGSPRLDLVGFSMGALVGRYFIQRLGGRERVRRFVSISGPRRGTLTAFLRSHPGIRDMRPGSALLRDLETSADAFRDVELHCLWTPFDLMIVPATSSVMTEARSVRRFPVLLHRHMLTDPDVIAHVVELLRA